VIPALYRILDSAEGATCLERVGDEWRVADYERGKPRNPQRFSQLWDAGAYLLGSLTVARTPTDRNSAEALADWPIQPLPGEPPLTTLTGKHIAVLMPGRELVRYGPPTGNLTYAEPSARPEPRHYRVVRELRALAGRTDDGTAYLLPRSVEEHETNGSLTV
jgi:hypothetical protein